MTNETGANLEPEREPEDLSTRVEGKIGLFENPAFLLFVTSYASLFFELLLIRWLTCDFVSFGVFKTFPLVTCFVGLGTGVAKGTARPFKNVGPALLVTVAATLWTSTQGFGDVPFPSATMYQWNTLGAEGGNRLILEVFKMTMLIVLLLIGPFGVMYSLGTLIGDTFNKLNPLRAYCIDIFGAIAGSITMAALSFYFVAPTYEVVVFAALALFLLKLARQLSFITVGSLAIASIVAVLPMFNAASTIWSPYYRIDVQEISMPPFLTKSGKKEDIGILLNTNHGFSQSFTTTNHLELSEQGQKTEASRFLAGFLDVRKHYYALPYHYMSAPKEVLILGAGSGSDVQEAVQRGVGSIDAVEIDSGTLNLAKKYNPYFNHPTVHYHLDDGRRFLARTDKKYDMIILACLDSRALAGSGSSMRTDCYIHTQESYQSCLKHLKDNGIMVLSFGASVSGNSSWLRDRIYTTLKDITGYAPIVLSDEQAPVKWPAYFFITGKPVKDGAVTELVDINSFTTIPMKDVPRGITLTDDWPFLYVRDKVVDLPYLAVLLLVVLITMYVGRQLIFSKKSNSDLQLFGLGAAFILVELQAISRLSLLFGATWVTSSIVINGVLLMILLANYVVIRAAKPISYHLLYGMLTVSMIGSYILPHTNLMGDLVQKEPAITALVTAITLLPILMAGLIFATAFKSVKTPSRSFAFNLLGSVLGGLLEYLSTYLGINNLILVALALYAYSYWMGVKPPQAE